MVSIPVGRNYLTDAERNFDPTGGEVMRKYEAEKAAEQKFQADTQKYMEDLRAGRISPDTMPPRPATDTGNIMAGTGGGGLPSGKGAFDPRGGLTSAGVGGFPAVAAPSTGGASPVTGTGVTGTTAPSGGNFASFLNNGQLPAGSTYTSKTSETVLPDWYTNYAMQVLSNQQDLASRPMPLFQGPRVAEFSPTTRAGFDMTGTAATAYQPALGAATTATTNAMNGPGGLSAAQPYLGAAGESSVANIGAYMNPYTDQVVNRIADLGTRNLRENIMPEIEGRYIQAGQLGFGGRGGTGTPSGMLTDTSRAIRDTSADILGKQTEALRAGYGEAATLAGTDLARQAGLASTAGNLGGSDATRTLSAAEQLAGLGGKAQELGLTGASALTGVGAAVEDKAQKNIDVAYGDFLRQQGYPQEQINAMLQTFGGVKAGVPTAAREEGIVPLGYQPELKPSTGETVGGALAALGGILGNSKEGSALNKLLGIK
jgi:hypothetical protein